MISGQLLNISKKGDSTAFLGNLCKHSLTFTVKNFLMFKWRFLCFSYLRLSLYFRCFSPFLIFISSIRSCQNGTQHSRCVLISAELREQIISLDLLGMLLFMQSMLALVFFAVRAHCSLMFNLSTTTPRFVIQRCFPAYTGTQDYTPSDVCSKPYWCDPCLLS